MDCFRSHPACFGHCPHHQCGQRHQGHSAQAVHEPLWWTARGLQTKMVSLTVCLPLCLSVCLFVCFFDHAFAANIYLSMSAYQSSCLPAHLFDHAVWIYLSLSLCTCLSACMSACLPVHLFDHAITVNTCPCHCVPVCLLPVCLSTCPSI